MGVPLRALLHVAPVSVKDYTMVDLRNKVREGLALEALAMAVNGHAHPEAIAITTLRDAGWRVRYVDEGSRVVLELVRPER